jgi:hypothetical protein
MVISFGPVVSRPRWVKWLTESAVEAGGVGEHLTKRVTVDVGHFRDQVHLESATVPKLHGVGVVGHRLVSGSGSASLPHLSFVLLSFAGYVNTFFSLFLGFFRFLV